jgi:hypothetical protein
VRLLAQPKQTAKPCLGQSYNFMELDRLQLVVGVAISSRFHDTLRWLGPVVSA